MKNLIFVTIILFTAFSCSQENTFEGRWKIERFSDNTKEYVKEGDSAFIEFNDLGFLKIGVGNEIQDGEWKLIGKDSLKLTLFESRSTNVIQCRYKFEEGKLLIQGKRQRTPTSTVHIHHFVLSR